jgi:hypothetical protein
MGGGDSLADTWFSMAQSDVATLLTSTAKLRKSLVFSGCYECREEGFMFFEFVGNH